MKFLEKINKLFLGKEEDIYIYIERERERNY